jgi:biopolymer transport protein ExbB/biopolymer transport protein TolQ
VAKVIAAGVTEFVGSGGDSDTRVEMVSRALDRSRVQTLTEMKRGLGGLATIGSTAPFIGLFGTVVGIINAFRGISAAGSGGVDVVSGGIAEALIATALGIFVAIPAVVAFNHFTGSLERFQVEMNSASSELVDFLYKATRQAAHASR